LVSDIPAGDGKIANIFFTVYTHKKGNEIVFINKKIQMGYVAKSYMRNGFLYEAMRKYLAVYEETVRHI
jgi:hypothetical protein